MLRSVTYNRHMLLVFYIFNILYHLQIAIFSSWDFLLSLHSQRVRDPRRHVLRNH
jgi:hypothetical protein